MPNHITNIVYARPFVLKTMLTGNHFNFKKFIPFPEGIHNADGFGVTAEHEAKANYQNPDHVYSTEEAARMAASKVATGYLHVMDFAIDVWGTKWNSYDNNLEKIEEGRISFDTAWATPVGIWEAIARKYPCELITVHYADEDIGSNCGIVTICNGQVSYNDPDIDPRLFAFRVKGWSEEEVKEYWEEMFEDDDEGDEELSDSDALKHQLKLLGSTPNLPIIP